MYILFYKGTKKENPNATILDRLICLFDRGRYSHVEFVLPTTDFGSGYVKTWGSHAGRGGVSDGFYRNDEAFSIVEIDDRYLRALTNNQHYITGNYNYFGLPKTKFDWWPSSDKKWFCSELMAYCFGISDYKTFGVEDFYIWLMSNPDIKAKLIRE